MISERFRKYRIRRAPTRRRSETMETITQSVGVRNGRQMMPNRPEDMQTITGLLDRIPGANGGTQEIAGNWSADRTALIVEVTAAIVLFQTVNGRPSPDGVVDPGGGTL